MKRLSILTVAAEVDPFSKTGGLGDVARSLPKSLARLGHQIAVVTPLYKKIIDVKRFKLKKIFSNVPLSFAHNAARTMSVYEGALMDGVPIYFISCDKYFGKKQTIYGSKDENKRFYVLCRAALALPALLKTSFDIIHCHDWHTGLIPELLKKHLRDDPLLAASTSVFTIHNLGFQFGHNWWEVPGPKRDRGTSTLPDFEDTRHLERINFTKRGILYADAINTVSETYAAEIMEKKFGQDLHRILQNRAEKVFGIVNGIDYHEYNPAEDPGLAITYAHHKIHRKRLNKRALQQKLKLEDNLETCVIVMTSRVAEQKGFDLVLPLIPTLMQQNVQLVFLGDGEKEYLKQINKYVREYPSRIAVRSYEENRNIETMLYAGGDISLYPSRFEPCGTGQLKSLRYGCVPIARQIGGLSETVIDVDVEEKSGNGFIFSEYTDYALLSAISRAIAHFQHRRQWRELAVRGMKQSNSWELPARKYVELFRRAITFKNENHDNH